MTEVRRKKIAKLISDTRALKGFTLADVSKLSGVNISIISRVENGLIDVEKGTIVKIARALKIKPEELLKNYD